MIQYGTYIVWLLLSFDEDFLQRFAGRLFVSVDVELRERRWDMKMNKMTKIEIYLFISSSLWSWFPLRKDFFNLTRKFELFGLGFVSSRVSIVKWLKLNKNKKKKADWIKFDFEWIRMTNDGCGRTWWSSNFFNFKTIGAGLVCVLMKRKR